MAEHRRRTRRADHRATAPLDRDGPVSRFLAASVTDALYNTSGGSIVRDATGKSGTHIGQEVDAYTWYELNRHVNVGVGVGRLMGGEFLERTTKGPNYTYPYFAINFKDDGKSR